jgi:hypothetical protein
VAEIAELRGKGAELLGRLLRAGARAPALPAPARPQEFQGRDSELLRLQDEVLALALEALRRPDAPPPSRASSAAPTGQVQ